MYILSFAFPEGYSLLWIQYWYLSIAILGNSSSVFYIYIFTFQAKFMRIIFLTRDLGILSIKFSPCWSETRFFCEERLWLLTSVPLPTKGIVEVLQKSWSKLTRGLSPCLPLSCYDKHSRHGVQLFVRLRNLEWMATFFKLWLCNEYSWKSSWKYKKG